MGSLACLANGLEAVVQTPQQVDDDIVADVLTHRPQRLSQVAQAATGP